jgi:hypothetical protein
LDREEEDVCLYASFKRLYTILYSNGDDQIAARISPLVGLDTTRPELVPCGGGR